MPDIRFGTGSYRRDTGRLPEFRLVNMFAEKAPTAETQVAIISRDGLEEAFEVGAGPVHSIFSQPGTFGGDVFSFSGAELYRETTLIASLEGAGPVSWAASANEVVVARGGKAYSYNGTDIVPIAFPNDADVTAVAFVAGLFLFARADSHKFYWSAVLDGRSVDPLDFASAESAPDALLDMVAIGDVLVLLGQNAQESWAVTGELYLPFTRIPQRTFAKGIKATGCATEQDNALTWVGHDSIVYRLGDVPQRISDHGLEERIGQSVSVLMFSFVHEGHSFAAVRLDEATFLFDAATGEWCEFTTGEGNWRARCSAQKDGKPMFGDDRSGALLRFAGHVDAGEWFEQVFTAGFTVKSAARVDALDVDAAVGWAESPILEMRSSRDAGATWGAWRATTLGEVGQYRKRVRYRRAGLFDAPGAIFEFRNTSPAQLRVSAVRVNEAGGGRGRA